MHAYTSREILDTLQACKVGIQEAKYLIKTGRNTMNISDVSEKAGFTNVNTFIRIFKKYEGITPGKYKEMVQQEERNR